MFVLVQFYHLNSDQILFEPHHIPEYLLLARFWVGTPIV
uniref:Uncharacterized protein n=1 Tax=Arundo donax TaxID=35708 RepID=A0A0A9FI71_ARUDO